MSQRDVTLVRNPSRPTLEGAGVHLRRAFGFGQRSCSTRSSCSTTSAATTRRSTSGFPWHPHRGIETITYMIEGESITVTRWATTAPSAPVTSSG